MPGNKGEQKLEETPREKVSQFYVKIDKAYEALFKRYQKELELEEDIDILLSEYDFIPDTEEGCASIIEGLFEKIAQVYIKLQEERPKDVPVLPYSTPKYKRPDQFCKDINYAWKVFYNENQEALKLEKPPRGFLSDEKVAPKGELACYPFIKEAYEGLVHIHLLLSKKYPDQAAYHYYAIGLLNRVVNFAGYTFRYGVGPHVFISLVRKQLISAKTRKQRKKLSRGLEGFESKEEGVTKEFSRMLKVSYRFFDVDRSRNKGAKKLSEGLQKGRQGVVASPVHNISNMSGRAIITADAGALKHQLQGKDLDELATSEGVSRHLGYSNKEGKKKQWFYEWEAHKIDGFVIKSQINPQAGHLGNFIIPPSGLGKYGAYEASDILATINEFTGSHPSNTKAQRELAEVREKQLAGIFLKCARKCIKITKDMLSTALRLKNIKQTALNRLNRLSFLVNFKEISRRMHPGRMKNDRRRIYDIEEVAFAVGHIRALRLIAAGHLTMSQVFDANAPYGLPSGTRLNKPYKIEKLKEKLEAINKLYMEKMLSLEERQARQVFLSECPNGYVGFFREPIHQELRSGYGGEADTDDEEYVSSDEDTLSYRR